MANFARIVVIVTSMFMLVGGMILNLIGLISPSWQVVDIREFQAEHHVSFYEFDQKLTYKTRQAS
jgi:hypothetical protein